MYRHCFNSLNLTLILNLFRRIWYYLCLTAYLRVQDHVSFCISFSIQNLENRLYYEPLEEKKIGGGIYCSNFNSVLASCYCLL